MRLAREPEQVGIDATVTGEQRLVDAELAIILHGNRLAGPCRPDDDGIDVGRPDLGELRRHVLVGVAKGLLDGRAADPACGASNSHCSRPD